MSTARSCASVGSNVSFRTLAWGDIVLIISLVSLLSIDPRESRLEVRGFYAGSVAARVALERHGAIFICGYNSALETHGLEELTSRLLAVPPADRGFAYEGSSMALALLDLLIPGRRNRLSAFLRGPADAHVYMVHVGAGLALARLRLRARRRLRALDPFLRWLSLDGYGFHDGFFRANDTIAGRRVPRRLCGYERRVFDQGLGRALWFVGGADVERAARDLNGFSSARHCDLWSGLGLAAAYTTAAGPENLMQLRTLAGCNGRFVAQGAAFAVTARHRAGNVVEHTRNAADVLCGRTVEETVAIVRQARSGLVADCDGHSYERWRVAIARQLANGAGAGAK